MKALILAIFIAISTNGYSQVVDSPYNEDSIKIQFLKLLNDERKAHGLSEVEYHDTLNLLSYLHSKELTEKDKLFHSKLTVAHAENCMGSFSVYPKLVDEKQVAKILFTTWKESPGHYKNMLRKDTIFIGLGLGYKLPTSNIIIGSLDGYATLMIY